VFEELVKDYTGDISDLEIVGHSLAGAFKLWFREMADPVVPFDKCEKFLKLSELQPHEKLIAISDFIQKDLPKDNRIILEKLLIFLSKISTESSNNKMTTNNLSIVFASNIIRPLDSNPIELAAKTPIINGLFRTMLGIWRIF
jgi:hypothetical protein